MIRGRAAISLGIFSSRLGAICEEMGALLRRAALSSNIKDRLDYSCAVFSPTGGLGAQAAHIPVHLGSMAYALAGIVGDRTWADGDMLILNDPFLGGTHLPDVTLIAPVFLGETLVGFVANRAHHARIGAVTPGSMPLSRRLEEEGIVIPPTLVARAGELDHDVLADLLGEAASDDLLADLMAQASANRRGRERLRALVSGMGEAAYRQHLEALDDYAERLAVSAIERLPSGEFEFTDHLDDDGFGNTDIPIRCRLTIGGGRVHADFSGTAPQVEGNVNCPLPVTAAALLYCFRCLMPARTPACAGMMRPLTFHAPEGSLVHARRPAAVTAGNVETSTRIVDVVLGALARACPDRLPAASQGTMNNVAMGGRDRSRCDWDYYETLAGGMGAGPSGVGRSAVHSHMTNTRNTPIEHLEMNFPLRLRRYELRDGSGGSGRHRGGDGLVREYEILEPAVVTLLTERRRHSPWGLAGGGAGRAGRNLLNGEEIAGKCRIDCRSGDRLTIETPGGGGWGPAR